MTPKALTVGQAVKAADKQLVPYRWDRQANPVAWRREITVQYRPAGKQWRPAEAGENCRAGGGGHGAARRSSCGLPAIVVEVQRRVGPKLAFDYLWGLCSGHAGGRLPLPDGRVAEPVDNPLGGA